MSNKYRQQAAQAGRRGILLIVSAPAGTGKTTLVEMLAAEFPHVVESVSSTTRAPREGETDGVHYHFVSVEEFEQKLSRGEFLETVTFLGNHYGTDLNAVQQQQEKGNHVVLTIDTEGALNLMERLPAVSVFIKPPTHEELRRRLIQRKTESPAVIEQRLKQAEHELQLASQYDYQIVNDDLDVAYEVLRSILIAEAHRVVDRQTVNKEGLNDGGT